ncbi:hypothetical protein ACHAXT_000571 [Thalassiosira profunda]
MHKHIGGRGRRPTTMPLAALLLASLLLAILSRPAAAWSKRQDAHGKTIIAYYASWQWYDRDGLAAPPNLDHSKVTRYNFAFFQINSAGELWGTDSWADAITLFGKFDWQTEGGPTYCSWDAPDEPPVCEAHHYETGLISQAHAAGVEVYPSIGGWTLSDPFPALAADPAARENFANNCVQLIEAYDFDGIDIDWEYPGYADHSGTPADTINYSLFLREIRDKLDELGERTGRFYGLTAALPCGPDLIGNIQIDVVTDILTEFNLMTYDFHGSWNPETGANAPLYDMPGSPEFSVDSCVKNWRSGGARDDQINIGLPFYGRSFAGPGLTGWGKTHSGYADTSTWADDEGSPQYFNIVDKISQFTTVRDPVTSTQFAYNNVGFLSYDDPRAICDKTEYAIDEDLNGYIIWEISGDLLSDLRTPLLDAMDDRLKHPGVRCKSANYGSGNPGPANDGAMHQSDDAVVTTGAQWYPNQASLGAYCVNDGKQLEYYVAPDQIYPSAEKCCQKVYKHESNCVHYSNNPGSDGGYIDDGSSNPWYPHPDYKYCRNDGDQKTYFIFADQLFSSAGACCDSVYSYDSSCLPNSLNPGSNGQWVKGVSKGDPWYPEPKNGKELCKNNGKHKKIQKSHLFTSAEACCDAVYSYDPACLSKSGGGSIASAGDWGLNPTPRPTKRPNPVSNTNAVATAPNAGKNTKWNYCGHNWANANAVCGVPCFAGNDDPCEPLGQRCFADATGCPPNKPEGAQIASVGDATTYAVQDHLFYPHYSDDGASPECRNDGNAPGWMKKSTLKQSKYQCCASSFFEDQAGDCNADHPFYPDFDSISCVNDGNQPDWMVGDYLAESIWLCCRNFFQHDKDLLERCTGFHADCDNCESWGVDSRQ